MKKANLKNLFISELKELLDAEQQLIKTLPSLIKAAESKELKEALTKHVNETETHENRILEIFGLLGVKEAGEKCEAMRSMIQDSSDTIKSLSKSPLRDAAIIAKVQNIEHYEISMYGTLRTFAKELELEDIELLLQETLNEEAHADKLLSKIAEGSLMMTGINQKAAAK
jgi:ferritin-like metal-binding protein YciE